MEGGRVVQIGTPQELISQPANDYVRSFFKSFNSRCQCSVLAKNAPLQSVSRH
jgi:glycine betaine/proline transport system ATP-binding protein